MTISEFSRAIGVSPTTVSRAIHGRGRISQATRSRVLQSMKEFGYIPNVNAQRLSHGRTHMIALDFGVWHDYLSDMYFVEITRGVEEVLEERGYGVVLSGPGAAFNRWVKTRAVDAVILMGNPADKSMSLDISNTGTPCVVIGNHPVEGIPRVGSVVVGIKWGAQQTARFLVERGHRRIGYIAPEHLDDVYYEFSKELDRFDVALPEELVVNGGHSTDDGARSLCKLLAQPQPPTAVFARTDGLAFGALGAAHRMGLRIPEDFSLVGHDDVSFARMTQPPLTTVRVDCARLARLAADTLFSLLDDPGIQTEPQIVPTELVIRDSVSSPRPWELSYREPMTLISQSVAEGRVTA